MNIIKWRDSYNIDIESMDMQHKKIIELVNKLYNVIRNDASDNSIVQILEEMTKYAEKHLQEEEVLLKTNNYPDLTTHLAMHQLYRDRLNTLLQDLKKGNGTAVMDTYSFLRQWWTQHIMTEDKKYGVFFKSQSSGISTKQ